MNSRLVPVYAPSSFFVRVLLAPGGFSWAHGSESDDDLKENRDGDLHVGIIFEEFVEFVFLGIVQQPRPVIVLSENMEHGNKRTRWYLQHSIAIGARLGMRGKDFIELFFDISNRLAISTVCRLQLVRKQLRTLCIGTYHSYRT